MGNCIIGHFGDGEEIGFFGLVTFFNIFDVFFLLFLVLIVDLMLL
jgi:hypothetical protein